MNKFMKANKKIEDAVVSGYKAIETGVVGSYKKIEDKFVAAFLTPDDEVDKEDSDINVNTTKQGGAENE